MSIAPVAVSGSESKKIGLGKTHVNYQLSYEELTEQTLNRREGVLSDSGALCVNTGEFTGRCPKDKFVVRDNIVADRVFWNAFNLPIKEQYFVQLKNKMLRFLDDQEEVWVRDCYACADPTYRLNIRVLNENPWSNLFVSNMFIAPQEDELAKF
jgi:phosphoenolpyruvate carboxykinase (ATP)